MNKEPFKIIRRNVPSHLRRDVYHDLLVISWKRLFLFAGVFFFLTNALFATLYWLQPNSIQNSNGSWESAFFFSVQTMGTIGYGQLYPATTYANVLVTIQAFLGLLILAILTGLFFSKFSKPFAKIEFTDKLVVDLYDGKPTLMFRMLNIRQNQIVDSSVQVSILKEYVSAEGQHLRRFHDIKLVRSHVPMFSMSMNLMHVIDQASPLYGYDSQKAQASTEEILVTTIGTDGTLGQTIHASKSYPVREILWNRRFRDMVTLQDNGTRVVDYAKFNTLMD